MAVNSVNLVGRLTRDVELRRTQSGTAILSLSIVVNDRKKNPQTGEWEDIPNYVDLVMFGKRAESVAQYLSKGSKVAVQGKLRYSSWTTNDGGKRSKLEVVVDEIEFLSKQGGASGTSQQAEYVEATYLDDDLPW